LEKEPFRAIILGFMAIDPVKIPQNVSIEDRLIGPITLRQVFLCLIGGGISYAIWSLLRASGYGELGPQILSWIPLAIMATFAFVKINGISLFRICLLLLERSQKPTIRYWQPRQGVVVNPAKIAATSKEEDKHFVHKGQNNAMFEELGTLLDEGPLADEETDDSSGATLPVRKDRINVSEHGGAAVDTLAAGNTTQPKLQNTSPTQTTSSTSET
jgi:hypothetical protein